MNQFSSEELWWSQSAESNTSSKYKGVVPQPNGRWGAQIYENNHRLWLGTFDSQEAAAMSYDRAASMFRGSDATLNFLHHPHHVSSSSPSHEMEVEEEETVLEEEEDEREHMFEKPLTPSDVGKLNRLVIPKQYAEKYFPIGGSDSVDKGLLLSFEDEAGKVWKFRYSYWNSSQSYVLTKGWSRFVKDKQLDAGDVVWFERKMINNQHMLIRWRRRVPPPSAQDNLVVVTTSSPTNLQSQSNSNSAAAWTHGYYPAEAYPSHHYHHLHGSLLYQPDCLHAAVEPPVIQNPTTVAGNSKRLRLFGVNLDCQLDEPAGPEDGSYDFLSSNQAQAHYYTNASSYNNYKESNFSRDQTEDDRGRDLSM